MLLGLTGGIGSGKSTVSAILSDMGATIVDADKISRLVVMPGSPALKEIKQIFGDEMILKNGELDRKKLGRLVFADKHKLEKLNDIMNRRIKDEISRQIKESKTTITVLDAATLIEAGYDKFVDVLWIVDADDEVRIGRVMQRDNLKREEIIDRMNNQMNRAERLNRRCVVIDNSGSVEQTKQTVQREFQSLDFDSQKKR